MVACGFIMIDEDNKILMVKEQKNEVIRWSFPKGSREKTDKSNYLAARREFLEETGLVNFEYVYFDEPHIEYNERGNQSCLLYIARIERKFAGYGTPSDHFDTGGCVIGSQFMTLDEIMLLENFKEGRKLSALHAMTVVEFNQRDVFISPSLHTYISKRMSWLLRHNISNLPHDEGMYVSLDVILEELNKESEEEITITMLYNVVQLCPKQRFQINETQIRAVQGHSGVKIDEEEIFEEIHEAIPHVVHMTNKKALKLIRESGLNRMGRTHIHFADDESLLRKGQSVKIKLNMQAAMDAGIKFYRANNGVILSPGNETGSIPFEFLTL